MWRGGGGVGGEASYGKNFLKMWVLLLAGKARFIAELFHNWNVLTYKTYFKVSIYWEGAMHDNDTEA